MLRFFSFSICALFFFKNKTNFSNSYKNNTKKKMMNKKDVKTDSLLQLRRLNGTVPLKLPKTRVHFYTGSSSFVLRSDNHIGG